MRGVAANAVEMAIMHTNSPTTTLAIERPIFIATTEEGPTTDVVVYVFVCLLLWLVGVFACSLCLAGPWSGVENENESNVRLKVVRECKNIYPSS